MRHHFSLQPLPTKAASSSVNATAHDATSALHRRHGGAAAEQQGSRVGPLHGLVVVLVVVQLYAATVWIGRRLARRTVRGPLPSRHGDGRVA